MKYREKIVLCRLPGDLVMIKSLNKLTFLIDTNGMHCPVNCEFSERVHGARITAANEWPEKKQKKLKDFIFQSHIFHFNTK